MHGGSKNEFLPKFLGLGQPYQAIAASDSLVPDDISWIG